jgi:hypothetical protein
MSETADGPTPARPIWQPFTFGGLVVIARCGAGRILLAELVMAMFISGAVVYFAQRSYSPVILQAIQEMPPGAKISGGHLTGVNTTLVAGSKFLALAVTPETPAQIGQTADVQVQFRPANFRVGSVFRPDWGWEFDYPPGQTLDLSQAALEPWWGAWRPVIMASIGLGVFAALLTSWLVLATLYTMPLKILAWLGDRVLSWTGAWCLSSGGLLPGALVMGLGSLLYAWQAIDLVGLSFFWLAHLLAGWIYSIGGALSCPPVPPAVIPPNPFAS